jgi:hypothetical protein
LETALDLLVATLLRGPRASRARDDICLQLSHHADSTVRGNAVLGFGHLARRFGAMDPRACPVVEKALLDDDRYVRGQAVAVADDLRQFLGWSFATGAPRSEGGT